MIKNTEELLAFILTIGVIILMVVGMDLAQKHSDRMRVELFNKHPECLTACKPLTCIRFARKIERLGL